MKTNVKTVSKLSIETVWDLPPYLPNFVTNHAIHMTLAVQFLYLL